MALSPAEKQRRYRERIRARLKAYEGAPLHPDDWHAIRDEWAAKRHELEQRISQLERENADLRTSQHGQLLDDLNRAYAEGEADAIKATLERSKPLGTETDLGWVEDANWVEKRALFQDAPPLADMPPEWWIQHARETGAKIGQRLVLEARRECLVGILAARREAREAEEAAKPKRRRRSQSA